MQSLVDEGETMSENSTQSEVEATEKVKRGKHSTQGNGESCCLWEIGIVVMKTIEIR